MRVWNCNSDVLFAVQTIKTCLAQTGTVPRVLVDAYQESLSKVSRGMVQLFFERLAETCPEALAFFVEK